MDIEQSLLETIKYIFEKKNKVCKNKKLCYFIQSGVSFPEFIALIYNLESIPRILNNPETEEERNHNNRIALRFLQQKKDIKKMILFLMIGEN